MFDKNGFDTGHSNYYGFHGFFKQSNKKIPAMRLELFQ